MSQAEIEIVERVIDAWNRRDLDTMLALSDPEAEYVNAPAAVEPGTRHGHEGVTTVIKKQWEGLGPDARQRIDQAHVRGDEIVTEGTVSVVLPGSETRLENRVAIRWSFRAGRVSRLEILGAGTSFRTALRAAGIT